MAGPMSTGRPSIGGVDDKSVRLELLLRDVAAETGCLMSLLLPLPVVAWEEATLAEGWTVRDQVSHLTFSDNAAYLLTTIDTVLAASVVDRLVANVEIVRDAGDASAIGEQVEDLASKLGRHHYGSWC